MDEKILSMYARGMTVREIRAHLHELYAVEISPDLISSVTDAVLEEVKEWQNRPLEPLYPVIIFDALRVKIRDEGLVKNKAVYLAIGIAKDGTKDILGLWIEHTEGAKFWLKVMSELKNRGVQEALICLVDGLKGFPEAIAAIFPQAQIQTCIVHLLRHCLEYCSWKDRKFVAAELKTIYRAVSAEAAAEALSAFEAGPWGQRYPAMEGGAIAIRDPVRRSICRRRYVRIRFSNRPHTQNFGQAHDFTIHGSRLTNTSH